MLLVILDVCYYYLRASPPYSDKLHLHNKVSWCFNVFSVPTHKLFFKKPSNFQTFERSFTFGPIIVTNQNS